MVYTAALIIYTGTYNIVITVFLLRGKLLTFMQMDLVGKIINGIKLFYIQDKTFPVYICNGYLSLRMAL
jgi:hypothetical protein